jgi:probable HAF family extracellular repeat protein
MSVAYDVNDAGVVVGYSGGYGSKERACRWESGVPHDLGVLAPGDDLIRAYGINNNGVIVGSSFSGAFVYQTGGMVASLGLPQGVAFDINDNGHIVGATPAPVRAFLYSAGLIFGLGDGAAYAVNTLGDVVGGASHSGAFLFSKWNRRPLETWSGEVSAALGINNNGHIVGYYRPEPRTDADDTRAFVSTGIGMWDLNDLIATGSGLILKTANDVNETGQIVGEGTPTAGGDTRGFLLTPSD